MGSRFEIGDRDFLLDGEPFQVISGALHYFRVHPDQWADRIRKARLMGLNTIETYVAWNVHAPRRGEFDLTGPRDLGRFLDLIAAEGMYAIVRPGPYICAEWTGGGLPGWLLADPDVGVRRHEPRYLAAIAEYYAQHLPLVAARQIDHGGPVIAVQVENEYGAYGEDADYLRALIDLVRGHGITVPLLSCDQADDAMQQRGSLPELHRTITFGSRATERLALLRRHQPTGPLMCMEFWNGWFDSWGRQHHVAPPGTNAQDLDDLLAQGASVNLYMFHGGTNFGFTNGANDKGTYLPITTSYDYDAPLAEHGAPTPKFHAMREVIARYAPVPDELPEPAPPAPELTVPLTRALPLLDALDAGLLGDQRVWDRLPTMDDAAQWEGLIAYRTTITAEDAVLSVGEVRDRALVLLDGEPVGVLSRTGHDRTLPLPRRAGELTVLVEDQGRVNYGPKIGETKGLIGGARTAVRELTDWRTVSLELDPLGPELLAALDRGAALQPETPLAGPVLVAGSFDTVAGADHFLRTDGWGKGLVWVNGFLLGRYWSAGPTGTLYLPGPLLRETGNELVLLELHGAAAPRVEFVAGPDLGPIEE
ncbi:glycoside hydrolase family 35 protein [Cellulomonas denverensis]|uniref:Beta-galactosidase n=1 Tax=Cellulomonas denverensis TaxID=264297 RepID=A0A7X6KVP2_9CELL|nr:beta-galactosidase family protein [Cellulomonas denverensis]NKY22655.1 beta-galactosidase [Cellulomonas denverensis]GIG24697.1 beta-galactosidase [Cellulomonas denverensis]